MRLAGATTTDTAAAGSSKCHAPATATDVVMAAGELTHLRGIAHAVVLACATRSDRPAIVSDASICSRATTTAGTSERIAIAARMTLAGCSCTTELSAAARTAA